MSTVVQRAFNLRWSLHNPKIRALGGMAFGLPALRSEDGFSTCPQAGRCAAICYARQSKYEMPVVRRAREINLEFIRTRGMEAFIEAACEDLARRRSVRFVRVHDSGDFFSQEYLDAWYEIARRNETKTFSAYTTSFHLDLWSGLQANFRMVQSEGGRMDDRIDRSRPFARVFENRRVLGEAGFSDGSSEEAILSGAPRIGLVYNGRYAPTPEQRGLYGWKADVEVVGQTRRGPGRPRKSPPPPAPEPDVDLRGTLSAEDLGRVAEAVRALEGARDNLSGRLSEMRVLELKARRIDRIVAPLKDLLRP